MEFDINRPWLTLDQWQKDYIKADGNTFLLCGRQSGKSAAASIKFGERAVKVANSSIMMISFTEKQAFLLFSKCLNYLRARYHHMVIEKGKNKPTQHHINLTNGSKILCYACGKSGFGLVGHTITDLVIDEAHLMNRQIFIQLTPTLSVTKGTLNVLGTASEKDGYFYDCSDDLDLGDKMRDDFTRFYVNAEDCPRHTDKFLANERKTMTTLEYAQQYLAKFTDDLKRLFSDDLIDKACILERDGITEGKNYLGLDCAGLGDDLNAFEIVNKVDDDKIRQRESITTSKQLAHETSDKAIELYNQYFFRALGIDDGGVGFGVWCNLLRESKTKNKTIPLNNASRQTDNYGEKSTKLLKEEMYQLTKAFMENGILELLNDDEVKYSLKTIYREEIKVDGKKTVVKIWGRNSHITEGIIRAVWVAYQDKTLEPFAI